MDTSKHYYKWVFDLIVYNFRKENKPVIFDKNLLYQTINMIEKKTGYNLTQGPIEEYLDKFEDGIELVKTNDKELFIVSKNYKMNGKNIFQRVQKDIQKVAEDKDIKNLIC